MTKPCGLHQDSVYVCQAEAEAEQDRRVSRAYQTTNGTRHCSRERVEQKKRRRMAMAREGRQP
ncbi:uncharacterized protein SETTUDRAFT_167267 [Exserohilum turcica Et28A]|uniref:Uncharacterized protein n=1 Tax=Exserohilum turcicum (strain 28A) TaxID=671987 RepID=R0J056_EXST2|nr:uncharacterized protein SETTUDRAFT_167267 [Exserohilum turcica Et28A]EOA90395.1 hypothetical protein SETTUDRAFT_167267 [Exserohilum turcica Et28A]